MVVAWGSDDYGQTNVPVTLTNSTAIAGGIYDSLAVRNDGSVLGWGFNSAGQANSPAGLSNVTAIAAGYYHSLALRDDGSVAVWGAIITSRRIYPHR